MTRDIKSDLLDAGTALARENGWPGGVTKGTVAKRAGCSPGMLNWTWGGIDRFHEAVMERAVTDGDLQLVAQGLAHASPAARAAPERLRRAALTEIMGI